jgi:acyl-CoA dehydrogenase
MIAAYSMGAIEGTLDHTIRYARERKVLGSPLIERQSVAQALADMTIQKTVARSFTDRLIQQLVAGHMTRELGAIGKIWMSELHCEIVDKCLQFFGGYGCITDYPIAKFHMDSRVFRIVGGANDQLKSLVARSI